MNSTFRNIELIPAMAEVVANMRETYTYTSIYDGTYSTLTFTTPTILKKYDTILINDQDVLIYDVNQNKTIIKVKGDTTAYTTAVTKAPYFLPGHILEIANILTERDKSNNLSFQKYPLVILPLDIKSTYNKKLGTADYTNVVIYIVNITKAEYRTNDRLINNFRPVLYPLYEKLVYNISKGKQFNNGDSVPYIDHDKTDRFFWGTEVNKNSAATILNDYIDAVELTGITLKVKNTKC